MPWRAASAMISDRSSVTSRRTSAMSLQIPVPTSTTDWCISGLTRSFRIRLPSSRSSWTWECSSRVSGSMIWNSSSTPRVKAGRCRTALAPGPGRGGRGEEFIGPGGDRARALPDTLDQPARGMLEDPVEVVLADRVEVGVGSGVQEVDCVGDTVADRELESVEVVPESSRQLAAVPHDALVQGRLDPLSVTDVALVMGTPRVVAHDVDVAPADRVAAEVLGEVDLLLERHHVLPGRAVDGEELVGIANAVDVLPAASGVRLEVRRKTDMAEDLVPRERVLQVRHRLRRRVGRMLVGRQEHGL